MHDAMTSSRQLGGDDPSARRRARRLALGAHALGWVLFGVISFLSLLPTSEFPTIRLFAFKMFWAATGFAVSTGLAGLSRVLRLAERRLVPTIASTIVLSAVVAVLWVLGVGGIAYAMHGRTHMMFTWETLPLVASNHFFILLAWSGGYLTLTYWRKSQAEAQKSLEALGLAREAQLESLRYQLNPHFLFNAMTSVRALIGEQPARARETLTRLSDFLRYTLSRRAGTMASVAEEIEIVRDYLSIERVRFEERLDVSVDLDPTAADEHVPVFLLHTLVENAVKHGRPHDGRLSVAVRAAVQDSRLHLEVANTGDLNSSSGTSPRIGLRNVQQRLQATFPDRHRFEIEQDGEWVRARIEIDLRGAEDDGAA